MRILHVTRETGSDVRYGIRKSLVPVLNILRDRGHTVELFDQNATANMFPAPAARMLERVYFSLLRRHYGAVDDFYLQFVQERVRVCWAAAQFVREAGTVHVHCHDPLIAYIFRFFSCMLGLKGRWGYSIHSFGRYVQPREGIVLPARVISHLQSWENSAARNAAWVVSPSHSGLEQMAGDLGITTIPDRWHVVPHPRPILSPVGDTDIREEFGIGGNSLLLAVGQLIPIKRFNLLIEAVSSLPERHQPHLIILGEGPQESFLKNLADKLGIGKRLHIAVTDNISDFFAAADIYVSTSSTESYGMANSEALAAGLPSVCCSVGAVPEVVADGACLTGETVAEISGHISKLLDSPEERKTLAKNALNRASQWWGVERVADSLERIYAANHQNAELDNSKFT